MWFFPKNQIRFPLPRNDDEFSVVTKWLFDRELHLAYLSFEGTCGNYRFKEKFDDYADSARVLGKYLRGYAHSVSNFDYDANDWFVSTVFGVTTCGGIAGSSYAQFRCDKGFRRQRALLYWVQQRQGSRVSALRPAFERLAMRRRAWREQNDSR
jgi:hypothetical protein